MRSVILALALCAAPLALSAQQNPPRPPRGVQAQYDRIQNQTVIRSEILDAPAGMLAVNGFPITVEVVTLVQGTDPTTAPDAAVLRFTITPRLDVGWKLLNAEKQVFFLLADGRRAAYPGHYSNSVGRTNLTEVLDVPISLDDLLVLSTATRIEGRVGPKEFKLEEGSLKRLQAFLGYVGRQPVDATR